MLTIWIYTIFSVFLISLVAFIGIFTLTVSTKKLKRVLFLLVSFSAGALLGDAFIHLLPEVVEEYGFTLSISFSVLAGIAFSFIIEKVIHWHHCHHAISHEEHIHPFAIMNLLGDLVHNFVDGLIIGASYLVSIPVGIATTVAVVFHEIPQEISDFGVLIQGGFSRKKALFLNFITALAAVVGAVVALIIHSYVENLTIFLVPFSAGTFIYIAAADLIPELHKELKVRKSIWQFVLFILGICVMASLLFFE